MNAATMSGRPRSARESDSAAPMPRGAQHPAEHPAGAGDEDDRADRPERVVEQPLDVAPAAALPPAEHDDRDQQRDEQGDRGLAEQDEHLGGQGLVVEDARGAERRDDGVEADEDERQQQDPEHRAERRQAVSVVGPGGGRPARGAVAAAAVVVPAAGGVGVVRDPGVGAAHLQRGGDVEPAAGPAREQVDPDVPGRDRDEQADEQREADVRPDQLGGGDRARVRRHERVHGREGAGGGQRVEQQRAAEAPGDGEDDRQEHHEAGVEEDREAEHQRGHAEGERGPLLAEAGDEGVGEHLRAAGHLEQAADHHAEADEQRHRGQRACRTR